jgi:type IV pilus assembly protein PilW
MTMTATIKSRYGFTLVELLIAIAVGGVVMAGICSAYYSQQESYITQDQVSAMQQNLRAGLWFMEREIRMAGYDPTGTANTGIVTANATSIRFTLDLNADGDTDDSNEDITYSLDDSDGDGDSDLARKVGVGNNQPVADNINALNFVYLDQAGYITTTLPDIRSVQVTLVARAQRPDARYTDTASYANQQGEQILSTQNDNFRRKRLTAEIKCRNLGFN